MIIERYINLKTQRKSSVQLNVSKDKQNVALKHKSDLKEKRIVRFLMIILYIERISVPYSYKSIVSLFFVYVFQKKDFFVPFRRRLYHFELFCLSFASNVLRPL